MNNASAKHASVSTHSIDWNNAKTLYKSNLLSNRLIVESALIKTVPNFNNCQSSVTIEKFAAHTIVKNILNSHPPD